MHHAYLLIGERETCLNELESALRVPSTDVVFYENERFGIGEVRSLREEASLRPLEERYRNFVLIPGQMTTEAQNALLKILEDPMDTARFYIITRSDEQLLPTLRSRLMIRDVRRVEGSITKEAQSFVSGTYAERLEYIAERIKDSDFVWIKDLLSGLEVWAQRCGRKEALEAILLTERYIERRGASKKMLLEHLALTLSAES